MMAGRRTILRKLLIGCLVVGALWASLSMVTATTRQGVNFHSSVRRIPLYAKAIAFWHRHVEYGVLAQEITKGFRSDPERVQAIFTWTREHIRPTPKGWPVIDDHVLHIIIRGHGLDDQMADVFTTLTTYAGLPGFWRPGPVVFSFVRVEGRWAMFDVAHGLIFTDASGQLIEADELIKHPELAQAFAGTRALRDVSYRRHLEQLRPFRVPEMLRARQQMPLPRLVYEARHFFYDYR